MRTTTIALVILLMVAPACQVQNNSTREDMIESVVFVCEHGSVKSLIAASHFARAAEEQRLPFRAVSRGLSPDDKLPPWIVAALRADGFEVEGFRPQKLARRDVRGATRVVAIGVDLTAHADDARVPIQSWDDVPAASVDYAAARAALQRHIDDLLDELQVTERAP